MWPISDLSLCLTCSFSTLSTKVNIKPELMPNPNIDLIFSINTLPACMNELPLMRKAIDRTCILLHTTPTPLFFFLLEWVHAFSWSSPNNNVVIRLIFDGLTASLLVDISSGKMQPTSFSPLIYTMDLRQKLHRIYQICACCQTYIFSSFANGFETEQSALLRTE